MTREEIAQKTGTSVELVMLVIELVSTIIASIKEAGTQGVPSGHLYAKLMTAGCPLHVYEKIESKIISTGVVEKRGDVLYYIGQ